MATATIEVNSPPPSSTTPSTMKALVYRPAASGLDRASWEDMPRPVLKEDTDAIVRITTTTICGTDLHMAVFLAMKASALSKK